MSRIATRRDALEREYREAVRQIEAIKVALREAKENLDRIETRIDDLAQEEADETDSHADR